jgi:RimJ/RimL family protein N-acetyltransferase
MWQIPDLLQTIHDAPHDKLVTVDQGWSESEIRQREQALQDSGIERWTGFLRDTSSGRLVAYSEIYVTEMSTALADQGDTAVRAEWRGQGLGKWVKAATIESFSRARPQTRYLTTSNAVTNSAILKINEQLGFRRLNTMTIWQLSVSKALASLAR